MIRVRLNALALVRRFAVAAGAVVVTAGVIEREASAHAPDHLADARRGRQRLDAARGGHRATGGDGIGADGHLLRQRPAGVHGRAAAVRLRLGSRRRRARPSRPRRRHAGGRPPADRQRAHEGSRIYRTGPHRGRARAGHRHAARPVRARAEAAGFRDFRGRRGAADREPGERGRAARSRARDRRQRQHGALARRGEGRR